MRLEISLPFLKGKLLLIDFACENLIKREGKC